MLSWSMGTLATHKLLPSAALGYALALRGAATEKGIKILTTKIRKLQSMLKESDERQIHAQALAAQN
jgi:hypothetical protein